MAVYRPFCSPANCLVVSGVVDQPSTSSCPAVSQLYTTLQDVFGHTEFRPGQLEAAVAAMHGCDVFAQMCTGAGKTLCMFLPPLAMSESSVGVVISPLNAIMDEQVHVHTLYFSIVASSQPKHLLISKILKLRQVGVPAIRVTNNHTRDGYVAVESGQYRLGTYTYMYM